MVRVALRARRWWLGVAICGGGLLNNCGGRSGLSTNASDATEEPKHTDGEAGGAGAPSGGRAGTGSSGGKAGGGSNGGTAGRDTNGGRAGGDTNGGRAGASAGSGGADPAAQCPSGSFDSDPGPLVACRVWSTCIPSEYVANQPSAQVDQVCAPCPAETFSAFADQAQCYPWKTCESWQHVSREGTASTDRVCSDFGLVPELSAATDIAANTRRIYLTGNLSPTFDEPDAVVFATDGQKLSSWTFMTDLPHVSQGVAVDSQGAVYVAGTRWRAGAPESFLRKVDESGGKIWEMPLAVLSFTQSIQLVVGPQDSVYAAYAEDDRDPMLGGYSVVRHTSTGAQSWSFNTIGEVFDSGHDVFAVDGSGYAYVLGDPVYTSVLLRLTPNGDLDDTWTPEDAGITRGYAVAATDQYVDLAGEVTTAGASFPAFRVARYDVQGKLLWSYDLKDSRASSLVVSPDGSLYCIGNYTGSSSNLITKLSSGGAWSAQRIGDGMLAGAWGDKLYVAGRYYVGEGRYEGVLSALAMF